MLIFGCFTSVLQFKDINNNNKVKLDYRPIYFLIGYFKLSDEYGEVLPSINAQIDHLENIASKITWNVS